MIEAIRFINSVVPRWGPPSATGLILLWIGMLTCAGGSMSKTLYMVIEKPYPREIVAAKPRTCPLTAEKSGFVESNACANAMVQDVIRTKK